MRKYKNNSNFALCEFNQIRFPLRYCCNEWTPAPGLNPTLDRTYKMLTIFLTKIIFKRNIRNKQYYRHIGLLMLERMAWLFHLSYVRKKSTNAFAIQPTFLEKVQE
jgi:hypothetical protein